MPLVTAIRAHGRGLVEVDLDGRAWRVVPLEAVVATSLSPGSQLDRQAARTLRRAMRRVEAREAGLRALRRRDLSERQLAERLDRAGVAPADASGATDALARAGLVDDGRLARSRAAGLAGRGFGDAAIRDDLERRGIAAETIADALSALPSETARAAAEIARRGASRTTAGFLLRRGFDADVVEGQLETIVAGAEGER